MSKFYDSCDAIAALLGAVPLLAGVPIVVDRQKDVASALKTAIGKQAGCIIIIAWAGANNDDLSADGPRFASRFTATLMSKPVIRRDEAAADDIVEAMATALHDTRLAANAPYRDRLVVTGIDPVPHDELLIHRINLTATSQL